MDLYYDPVIDEHVGRGPRGLIAPTWYFAPQRPEFAGAGWQALAQHSGVFGNQPLAGLDNPANLVNLLQLAGEFADSNLKKSIWEEAEQYIEPCWDNQRGEFTLAFNLNEAHPRGQWNARSMAGWVCNQGDWSKLFNEPNLDKFSRPTVTGVDFPNFALSQANWSEGSLKLAIQAMNKNLQGSMTSMHINNLGDQPNWSVREASGQSRYIPVIDGQLQLTLPADNQTVRIQPSP